MLATPFEMSVAGVTFRPDYPQNIFNIAKLQVHSPVPVLAVLEREPENEVDEHAIKVLVNKEHVGYVPAWVAKHLSPELDQGIKRWMAIVEKIVVSPENTEQPGLRLKVYDNELK